MATNGTVRSRLVLLRSPVGVAAIIGLLVFALVAIIGVAIVGETADKLDPANALQPPSSTHPFGTDELGRDLLSRVIVATRMSLGLSILATFIGALVGTIIGTLPLVTGPRLGRLIAQGIAMSLAFPALLLALFVTAIIGAGARGTVVAIALAMAPVFARLTQTLAAALKNSEFLLAARMLGAGRTSVIVRHVLPNIGGPLLVTFMIGISGALVVLSGMSFLGLGIQPPSYDWGSLLNKGLSRIYTNPAYALGPALAVVVGGMVFSIVGDALSLVLGLRTPNARRRPTQPAPEQPQGAGSADSRGDLLSVGGLRVSIPLQDGTVVSAVRELGIEMRPGERVGIVGESGSGKSVSALAIARLLESPAEVDADRLDLLGTPLTGSDRASTKSTGRLLGRSLGMVFQDPFGSFNPLMRIGTQLAEASVRNGDVSRREARQRALERLSAVRLPEPERHVKQFPHQLSGGMLQRSMIAMGLMNSPQLIIADEPTTALDVTVQKDVLQLIRSICDDTGAGLLFISHDLAVVLELCERVLVMYAGRVVEEVSADDIRAGLVRHPYTQGLLGAVIDLSTERGVPLVTISGRPPSATEEIAGCAFAPRCPVASEECGELPPTTTVGPGHRVACWRVVQDGPIVPAEDLARST